MNEKLFVLDYVWKEEGEECVIFLGVFSSVGHCKKAMKEAQNLDTFSGKGGDFTIDNYVLNAVAWSSGFINVLDIG
jgi:hypothetical protein